MYATMFFMSIEVGFYVFLFSVYVVVSVVIVVIVVVCLVMVVFKKVVDCFGMHLFAEKE